MITIGLPTLIVLLVGYTIIIGYIFYKLLKLEEAFLMILVDLVKNPEKIKEKNERS